MSDYSVARVAYAIVLVLTMSSISVASNMYASLTWVVGESRDSHVTACSRIGRRPTDRLVPVDWNSTTISTVVVTGIQRNYYDMGYSKYITVDGTNFLTEENVTTFSVADETCDDIEIFSNVYGRCGPDESCPLDSECLLLNNEKRCYMFCAGPGDKTCPCNMRCEAVNINYNGVVHFHLCTP